MHDLDVERDDQDDDRDEERRQQQPYTKRPHAGRSTDSTNAPVVATTIWQSHEPNASTTVFQK